MHLREIEIKGFKSFAEKVVLQFPKGVSAIVGPNGSGKSNVVDALRWVLGEQSSKNLRTDSSVNLIFSGNEFKPVGQSAKVKLVFDEINRPDIIDVNAIEIEKIIHRDGKTEYFLNKKDAKQKDLISLLASLQFGVKGLSIISQGSIENILKVSVFERKTMFEEILGLRQLEMKKEASFRKLQNTNINLDKASSLVNEILPHFRSLKRYVSRFDKQKEYQDELLDLSQKYFGYKNKILNANNQVVLAEIQKIDRATFELEKLINEEKEKLGFSKNQDQAKSNISILTQKQKEIELISKELITQKQSLIYEMAKIEGKLDEKTSVLNNQNQVKVLPPENKKPLYIKLSSIEVKVNIIKQLIQNIINSNDLHAIKSNIVSIEKEIIELLDSTNSAPLETKPNNHLENLEPLKEEIMVLKNQILKLKEQIDHLNIQISEKEKIANNIEDEIDQESKNQRKMFNLIEQKQQELMGLQSQKQKFSIDFEKNNINIENLKNQVSSLGFDFESIINNEKIKELVLSDNDLKTFYDRIEKLRAVLNELGFVDQNIIDEYNDTQKRLEFLETQKADLEKAVTDLKFVIKELTIQINETFESSIMAINKDFNKYLEMIFGGGKGSLDIVEVKDKIKTNPEQAELPEILSNEDDADKKIGIEIRVKLPKTKLDGVEALSGGEKSLVSIALLFAIVSQSKPPLLVLDEVDAALDEENTRKFANILKDLSLQTQYILITHNWLTMSCANVIYGVTIGKEKFSQILSLELEDSKEFMKN